MVPIEEWDRSRAGELAALVAAALPGEGLTADELLACCWDDGGVVVGLADGTAAAAGALGLAPPGRPRDGWVRLVATAPQEQGAGRGRAVLAAVEGWLADAGAERLCLGGQAPSYLWPGLDGAMAAARALASSAGYQPAEEVVSAAVPAVFRRPAPGGIALVRPLDDEVAGAARSLAQRWWPGWVASIDRAVEQASVLVAVDEASGEPAGLVCHSVNRSGWVGPLGVAPPWRRRGIGLALLGAAAADLMVAGLDRVIVVPAAPEGFLAAVGASPWRSFRRYRKPARKA